MTDYRELERRLLAHLNGEASPAEAAELSRLESADVRWARRADQLRETWRDLAPPPTGPSPNLAPALLAEVRGFDQELSWALAPAWARAAAAVSLAAGLAMGVGLGMSPPLTPGLPSAEPELAESWDFTAPPSLTDAYWQALEESGGRLSIGDSDLEPSS